MSLKNKKVFDFSYDFLHIYLPLTKNKSPHTVTAYTDALSLLHQFAVNRGKPIDKLKFKDLSEDFFLEFRVWMINDRHVKPQTANHRFSLVRKFIKYCGKGDPDVMTLSMKLNQIGPLREIKNCEEALTEEQIILLLKQPDNSIKGIRDSLLIRMLYETATRIDELLSLKKSDVDIDSSNPHIVVNGKGYKRRQIPLNKTVCDHIRVYLSIYHNKRSPVTELLFYGVRMGKCDKLSEDCISHRLSKYEMMARQYDSSFPHLHSHLFRKSKATHIGERGADLQTVTRFLGHADPATTMIYVNPSQKNIREAIEKTTAECQMNQEESSNYEEMRAKLCGIR